MDQWFFGETYFFFFCRESDNDSLRQIPALGLLWYTTALSLLGSRQLVSALPASHLLKANMTIYVGCWEMINDGVRPNKYEIPGSLAGLDWREKCIISPWMHCSQEVIDIIA